MVASVGMLAACVMLALIAATDARVHPPKKLRGGVGGLAYGSMMRTVSGGRAASQCKVETPYKLFDDDGDSADDEEDDEEGAEGEDEDEENDGEEQDDEPEVAAADAEPQRPAGVPERRFDEDGAYALQEFIDYYGEEKGRAMWEAARPAGVDAEIALHTAAAEKEWALGRLRRSAKREMKKLRAAAADAAQALTEQIAMLAGVREEAASAQATAEARAQAAAQRAETALAKAEEEAEGRRSAEAAAAAAREAASEAEAAGAAALAAARAEAEEAGTAAAAAMGAMKARLRESQADAAAADAARVEAEEQTASALAEADALRAQLADAQAAAQAAEEAAAAEVGVWRRRARKWRGAARLWERQAAEMVDVAESRPEAGTVALLGGVALSAMAERDEARKAVPRLGVLKAAEAWAADQIARASLGDFTPNNAEPSADPHTFIARADAAAAAADAAADAAHSVREAFDRGCKLHGLEYRH